MEANGIINWTFIPITDVEIAQPRSNEERNLERLLKNNAGQKTLKLLPYLIGYFRKHGGSPTPALRADFESTEFGIGGAKVLLGRPYPRAGLLNEISVAQLILIPHLSARGPNGIWTIRRGPSHPLVEEAANISAYHLFDENGEPPIFNMSSPNDWPGSSLHCCAKGLDLFTSRRKAISWARELERDGQGKHQVVQANGNALLELLAHLDMAFYGEHEIAFTDTGCRATEQASPISSQDIIKLLSHS